VSNALVSERPTDALDFWYPDELEDLIGMRQGKQHFGDVMQHTIAVLNKTSPILPLRMAALLHDVGKPKAREVSEDGKISFNGHEKFSAEIAKKLLTELGFEPEFIHTVAMLCHNHMRTKQFGNDPKTMSTKAIRRIMVNAGNDFNLLMELIHADNCSHKPEYCLPDQIPQIIERAKLIKITH
jgi:putative nucleotidyltransferase with HDIG domain